VTAKRKSTQSAPEEFFQLRQVEEHEWEFVHARLSSEVHDELDRAIELMHAGQLRDAEKGFWRLIGRFPEFIDAYHHLAMVLSATGREQEALLIWQTAVDRGLKCFPEDFYFGRDLLPWGCLDNRPFLRAYHGLGLEHRDRGHVEEALVIFNRMLALNPSDNQGARALAVDCYFRLKQPQDVLSVCDRYPDDGMEDLVYGKVLALYQLQHKEEAANALQEAIEFLPLVAKELTKKQHRRPRSMMPGYVTHGGADQAYSYWQEQGQHWKNTAGAIDFVKRNTCGEVSPDRLAN